MRKLMIISIISFSTISFNIQAWRIADAASTLCKVKADIKGSLCETILKNLIKEKKIEDLNLESLGLGNRGAIMLSKFLEQYPYLSSLSVGGNRIGCAGAKAIVKALRNNAKEIALGLTSSVDARCMKDLAELLTDAPIESLSMWDSGISDDHLIALAQQLPNTKLKSLDFYMNNLTQKGVEALLKVLPRTKVRKVDLMNNSVNEKAISEFMEKNPKIEIMTGSI